MAVGRSSKGTVWNVQILRFSAAAMVLVSHLNHAIMERAGLPDESGFVPVWWAGGVDVFFVISGFIMYHIAADEFESPSASFRFLKRRLLRLAPPYWLFTALAALIVVSARHGAVHETTNLAHIVGSLLFFPVRAPDGKIFPVMVLGWTLEYEVMFYVLFAIGLLFCRRLGIAVVIGGLLAVAAGFLLQPLPMPFGFWCNAIVLEFIFGIGIAMLRRKGVRISQGSAVSLFLIAIIGMLWVQALGWPGVDYQWRFLWGGIPSLLCCSGAALVESEARPIGLRRLLVLSGDASYALYLLHPFVISATMIILSKVGAYHPISLIILAGGGSLAASIIFYSYLERPVYARLSRLFDGKAKSPEFYVPTGPAAASIDGPVDHLPGNPRSAS